MASNTQLQIHTKSAVRMMTVASLRQELAKRALPIAGLKSVLVQRLEEALENEGSLEPTESTSVASDMRDTSSDNSEASDISEDERGHKRKRVQSTEVTDVSDNSDSTIRVLSQHLKASQKEIERLQFQLEEAKEKVATAKLEGKREANMESDKEMATMRGALDVALRKREEMEFKLSQKDDELQAHAVGRQSEKQDVQHLKALKEEIKKRESLAFQCEQLKEQLDYSKQQTKSLQQRIETNQLHTDREKKETSRCLLEERGKVESIRVRMESQREELVNEWRAEFDTQIEGEREELKRQIRATKKLHKELKEKTLLLEDQMAEKLKHELTRLADMQADLSDKENQLRENDKLQEELDAALEQRQRSIDEEAARLESDKQEFEEKQQTLEKERQEFEERLWTVDRDAKRRRDKERALDDQVMELLAKNEALVAEYAHSKASLLQQVKLLTIDNERLQTSLALAQAKVVSSRGTTNTTQSISQGDEEASLPTADPAPECASNASNRLTRSQSQLIRTQEQQTRELLLSKTRSRPSYIPKPSSRKVDVPLPTKPASNSNNKENTNINTNSVMDGDTMDAGSAARKQRASMIPIRKGSSLLPPQIKALRS